MCKKIVISTEAAAKKANENNAVDLLKSIEKKIGEISQMEKNIILTSVPMDVTVFQNNPIQVSRDLQISLRKFHCYYRRIRNKKKFDEFYDVLNKEHPFYTIYV